MSDRTRALRYKRPALASMGAEAIMTELDEISENCNEIRYYVEQADNDETLKEKTWYKCVGGKFVEV